jgi:indolepyruvate ferredoxin oxidoreductase alpha subunit
LLGNAAVARGAYEAGVKVATAYPGTPSTEITEIISGYDGVYAEWSPNEKVAFEVALGASVAGVRALVCMKHVGVNVAADPLFTASYTGVNGGLVLVAADDPGMFSSQNEQDTRFYARAAHLPLIEPSDSGEAKEFTKFAFDLSEKYDTPVILRTTTRLAHGQSYAEIGEREEREPILYVKNPAKYVMMPANAKGRHVAVEKRMDRLAADCNGFGINKIEYGGKEIGVVCSGVVYQYVKEALPNASVLKLGTVYPLPIELARGFAERVDELIVIEELEPFIENQLKANGIACRGKSLFSKQGELSVNIIKEKIYEIIGAEKAGGGGNANANANIGAGASGNIGEKGNGNANSDTSVSTNKNASASSDIGADIRADAVSAVLPGRPPVLCAGCPHRGVFYVLNKLRLTVCGDIGCYTLGALPPLNAVDSVVCMGAGVGMAHGFLKALPNKKNVVAVIGDSTFIHSGITGLIDSVYNRGRTTVLILDNSTTGMTGHQNHPATGKTIRNEDTVRIDLEKLCAACGVNGITTVDADDIETLEAVLKREVERGETSVIIARRACELISGRNEKPYAVAAAECKRCGACMRIGCPAISMAAGRGAEINADACAGCGLCKKLCKFGAIASRE